MTIGLKRSIGASSAREGKWELMQWDSFLAQVRRLQMRIAKAIREEQPGKARALQWLLTHSHAAKMLAVKRVTENKGARTPGMDNEVWKTGRQKMAAITRLCRRGYQPQPLRRIYLKKKNGKLRPLSIPTMLDRAHQALHMLALQPVAESRADWNSYGFREGRCCADAIGQCFIALAKKASPEWVLEGDIKSCFDEISHAWLLENIPMDRRILGQWLQAGFMEGGRLFPTTAGTPQGGIASPLLANLTLDGLEAVIRGAINPRRDKVNFIRYADDFIVTAARPEILQEQVKPVIVRFLAERGLRLSEEKTTLTHIQKGFNFACVSMGPNSLSLPRGKVSTACWRKPGNSSAVATGTTRPCSLDGSTRFCGVGLITTATWFPNASLGGSIICCAGCFGAGRAERIRINPSAGSKDATSARTNTGGSRSGVRIGKASCD